MKAAALYFLLLLVSGSFNTASAQASKSTHLTFKSQPNNVSGVDRITPKEADNKNPKNGSGWNGSYIGMNAGTSFGATAGTNMVVPLGSSEQ